MMRSNLDVATPTTKSDEYLNQMRTVAIPDYHSTPGNKGSYALRRIAGDTAGLLEARRDGHRLCTRTR